MNAENKLSAARRSRSRLQPVVKWLARNVDEWPDTLKALVIIGVWGNGLLVVCLVIKTAWLLLVYLTLKAMSAT